MVLLRHEFVSAWDDGFRAPRRTVSRLIAYGRPAEGSSATSRTVSLPAAVAAERILAGRIDLAGVHIPISPGVYEPVLDALHDEGISFVERQEPA
jgi:saccharopine dehydrogenase (NADP+, L-glutamate forming)